MFRRERHIQPGQPRHLSTLARTADPTPPLPSSRLPTPEGMLLTHLTRVPVFFQTVCDVVRGQLMER